MNLAVMDSPSAEVAVSAQPFSIRTVPQLNAGMSCREALRTINGYPDCDYFLVIDKDSKPIGYLEKNQFVLALNGRMGLDLYYSKSVRHLMKRMPAETK